MAELQKTGIDVAHVSRSEEAGTAVASVMVNDAGLTPVVMVFKMILSKSIFLRKKNVFFHVFIFFHFFSKTAENDILHMSEFVFN